MTNQHPITPSPDLVQQWLGERYGRVVVPGEASIRVATQAARWGADQELDACCQALYSRYVNTGLLPATAATVSQEMRDWLRTTRRPKPPSLKEQALALVNSNKPYLDDTAMDIIRQALETQ